MTDKELIKQEIERRIKNLEFSLENNCVEKYSKLDILGNITTLESLLQFIDSLQEEPTSEEKSEKELAETYLAVFDKKYPILPTLKGKQKADLKNFLNKCQQEFGLKEFGIHPTQSKLFEKLTLLWAVWGAEHLEGLGKSNQDEFDKEPASEDLEEEINKVEDWYPVELKYIQAIARHFVEWQKQQMKEALQTEYEKGRFDMREEMMKDAVEAEVMYPASSSTLQIRYKLPKNTKLKYGDKVKIIIIKEEL